MEEELEFANFKFETFVFDCKESYTDIENSITLEDLIEDIDQLIEGINNLKQQIKELNGEISITELELNNLEKKLKYVK